jgi:hypothetical protein
MTVVGRVQNDPKSYRNRAGDLRVEFELSGDEHIHAEQRYIWPGAGAAAHVIAADHLAERILREVSRGDRIVVTVRAIRVEQSRPETTGPDFQAVLIANDIEVRATRSIADDD